MMFKCVLVYYLLLISHLPYFTEYTDDEAQIQKHSSVIVRRIPIGGVKPSGKTYIVYVYFTSSILFCPSLKVIFSLTIHKYSLKPSCHLMVVICLFLQKSFRHNCGGIFSTRM